MKQAKHRIHHVVCSTGVIDSTSYIEYIQYILYIRYYISDRIQRDVYHHLSYLSSSQLLLR